MPPASGFRTVSDAVAIASGTAKQTAATTQSKIEPGPACAAVAIQRVPTMQAIANSVTSRVPSVRRNAMSARAIEVMLDSEPDHLRRGPQMELLQNPRAICAD